LHLTIHRCQCYALLLCACISHFGRCQLDEMLKGTTLDEELLIAAVGRQFPAIHSDQSVYCIDCRQYLRRPLAYAEGMHTGCHPTLFDRAVNSPGFVDHFDSIRVSIDDDKDMKRQAVSVMLCDDIGRHGSMAMGKAVAECIAADPNCNLGTVHILADQHSDSYCGVCARCEFWTRRWISRNRTVKNLRERWFRPPE
jgi:hypothetical protein